MTRIRDIGPMHFPPSWYGGPPDPPDDWDLDDEDVEAEREEDPPPRT